MAYTFKHGDRPLDGYTIQRAVGKGGFGEVYYALSDGGREVALKYLRENPDVELRGVGHCINLKSPHLVSIFDVKQTADGEYVIIMEYCSGPSLRDLLIAEPNGFATDKAAFFAREIGKGLSYLHERGIVHRDLKPGNIFFDDGYVKIGDYGLSKFISVSRHSVQTASVGTVHYMAPEIGSGNYSRGVDIYALGVMLYEMLMGKVPFEGSTMAEVLMKHLTAQPEIDRLPHPFARVIRKALAKDPADRYQTTEAMMDEMLSGDRIQQSLAGFSPKSLEGAVAGGGRDGPASPYPSPNPPPTAAQTIPLPPRPPAQGDPGLPDRLARKIDRVSRKIEKRMSKFAAKAGMAVTPPPIAQPPRATPHNAGHMDSRDVPWATPAPPAGIGTKRFALTALLTAGLAIGLGFLVANTTDIRKNEEIGVAAGLLVVMLRLALALADKACRWFTISAGPQWAQHMVTAGAAAPLLVVGTGPAFDVRGGVSLFLGLLASAAFADWRKLADENDGTVRAGPIFGKAIGAMILTVIVASLLNAGHEESFMFIAAGVAACVALIVQAGASWGSWQTADRRRGGPGGGAPQTVSAPPTSPGHLRRNFEQDTPAWMHGAKRVSIPPDGHESLGDRSGLAARGLRLRGGFTRFFWALMAFVVSGGAIATFVVSVLGDIPYHGRTGVMIGCVACFVFAVHSMSKATPFAKIGFWRGALRPFILTLLTFGIGATTTAIARNWNHCERWGPGDSLATAVSPGELRRRIDAASKGVSVSRTETELHVTRRAADGTLVHVVAPRPSRGDPHYDEAVGNAVAQAAGQIVELNDRQCLRYTLNSDDRGGLVTGLVLCSLSLLTLLAFTGRRVKPPQTFLQQSATY